MEPLDARAPRSLALKILRGLGLAAALAILAFGACTEYPSADDGTPATTSTTSTQPAPDGGQR